MSKSIEKIPDFKGPSYAEVFAEFIDRYGKQVDDHYRFSREVGRLIGIAQGAAVEPLQKVLLDSMARAPWPMTFRETELQDRPVESTELWRGQFRGAWFRVVVNSSYRIELQISFNASLGEQQETWEVEWSR